MKSFLRFLSVSLLILSGLLLSSSPLSAQTTDSTRQRPVIRPSADTLPPPDSAANDMDVLVDSLITNVDTAKVSATAQAAIYKIVPKKATIRSVMLPGLGQVYNRQFWKVPLVVAGFTTFAIIITNFTGRYQNARAKYQIGYNIAISDSLSPKVVTEAEGRAITVPGADGREYSLNYWRQSTEFWRRWRDYNYIFAALFYGLNIVDANVSAHLKTFDVSDSLTLKYAPTVISTATLGFVPGVKLTLVIK